MSARSAVAVAVVGASVAGATCALTLARAGVEVLVLERKHRPGDKVCGEGLHPAGVEVLSPWIPGEAPALDPPAQIRGLSFHLEARSARPPLRIDFPDEAGARPGLGLHRGRLEQQLWWALADEPGVELRTGCAVRACRAAGAGLVLETDAAELCCERALVADGAASPLRAAFEGARALRRVRGRFGARARFAAPASDRVAVHFGRGLEAYVTPLGPRLVSVALLGREALLLAAVERGLERTLEELGALPAGPRVGPVQAAPHVGFPTLRGAAAGGRVWFAGDAARTLDPISGAGMTLAALGGSLAGALLAETRGRDEPWAAARRYERRLRAVVRPYAALTRLLLCLSASRTARRAAGRTLAARPALAAWLAAPVLAHGPALAGERTL